jgi:alpha-tubulin suppressor-like RCC1 family protein
MWKAMPRAGRRIRARAGAVAAVAAVFFLGLGVSGAAASTSAGDVFAFGSNNEGQLGNTTSPMGTTPNPTPTLVALPAGSGTVVQVAAGVGHTLELTSTGKLYAFGDNFYGELGTATNNGNSSSNPTPELVTLPGQNGAITHLAAGYDFSLVSTSTGQLYSFGLDNEGELGRTANAGTNPPALVTLPGQLGTITSISAGNSHTLVATSSGQVYAFGDNYYEELGDTAGVGTSTGDPVPTLVTLPGKTGTVVQVAAGVGDSFAVTSTGQLFGFGNNQSDEIDAGAGGDVNPPELVPLTPSAGPIAQVAAGGVGFFTLVLTKGGRIYGFGQNDDGQLGIGNTNGPYDSPTAVTLAGQGGAVTEIAAGNEGGLAVTSSGQLYTWGDNDYGELGTTTHSGTTEANPTPAVVAFPAGTTIDAVALGSQAWHTVALVSDLSIASTTLASGQVGSAYNASLSASGGTAPLSYAATGLPLGLHINGASGAITGIPTAARSFSAAFTVTDAYGSSTSRTIQLAIRPAPGPIISALRQSHSKWREGNRLPTIAAKSKPPVGTTFSFTLNVIGKVTFAFTQTVVGRKVKGACVAVTKHNRSMHKCSRTVTAGTLSFNGRAGTNKVSFQGRLSHSHSLAPGKYTLVVTAKASTGQKSAARHLTFTIGR